MILRLLPNIIVGYSSVHVNFLNFIDKRKFVYVYVFCILRQPVMYHRSDFRHSTGIRTLIASYTYCQFISFKSNTERFKYILNSVGCSV
jgi:hypothetical protein